MRKTKIVGTLGPASCEIETIKELVHAGLDVVRINFSHGTYESHAEIINKFKIVRDQLNVPIPLVLDTKGPEIRIGKFGVDQIFLEEGSKFTLTSEDIEGTQDVVSVTYKGLSQDLKIGAKVLIDDGLIELKVIDIIGKDILCQVINSGYLSSNKGVNIPDVYVNLPSLTPKDIDDIKFGIEQGFDFIAASFIRNAKDVAKIRDILEENRAEHIKIIAKIESRDGVNNIDSILDISDGIMVARGDLGVEIPPEEVPLVQKTLIRKANEQGKPVITATQMLESMINNPRPTRAEASDVANAIFDGTDAIMLSGETAKGRYPIESIKMMSKIALKAESAKKYSASNISSSFATNITNAIAYAACATAADLNAACIATVTSSGITPKNISKFRPNCPILAVTKNESIKRQLNLTWGCIPILDEKAIGDKILQLAVEHAKKTKIANDGDYVVIAAGYPIGVAGTTNLLKVQIIGDVLAKGTGIGTNVVSGMSNVIKFHDDSEPYFKKGEILVTEKISNGLIPFIKKCSALVVGSSMQNDWVHAEIVAKTLDIPVIICNQSVIDVIPNGAYITVDAKNGFILVGNKTEK